MATWGTRSLWCVQIGLNSTPVVSIQMIGYKEHGILDQGNFISFTEKKKKDVLLENRLKKSSIERAFRGP